MTRATACLSLLVLLVSLKLCSGSAVLRARPPRGPDAQFASRKTGNCLDKDECQLNAFKAALVEDYRDVLPPLIPSRRYCPGTFASSAPAPTHA